MGQLKRIKVEDFQPYSKPQTSNDLELIDNNDIREFI